MIVRARNIPLWGLLILCGSLLTGMAVSAPARAQDDPGAPGGSQPGDSAQQDNGDNNQGAPPAGDTENTGPVRLARFGFVRGNVTWRGDDGQDWSPATTNMPIRQGAQVWAAEGGRAEIQFDDGSILRLGNNAVVTLKTLYSDTNGEFTQIALTDGLVTLVARHGHSIYQIDTPLASMKTTGPSRVRLGVDEGLEVAEQGGTATIEGQQGNVTLNSGDYLDLQDANSSYDVRAMPGEDSWDQWNDQRDRILAGRPEYQYLPSNIALVAGDLDDYGTWREDPTYGHVWCPTVTDSTWRPYYDGHWTWVSPFGWTWVSNEQWGWAPYHYGTWVRASYGWGWCPGPARQYWSPAVVNFSYYGGSVGWCPLAPTEVRYPAELAIGFRSGNWSLFFSIGQAACYYPASANYCVARPFNTTYVNHVTYVNNVTNITNVYNNYSSRNVTVNNRFVSVNATRAAGASTATLAAFTGRGAYQPLARSQTTIFTRGQTFAAPAAGRAPLAGPIAARPTLASITPTRAVTSSVRPPQQSLQRPVFHASLPSAVRGNQPNGQGDTATNPTRRPTTGGDRLTPPNQTGPTRTFQPGSAAEAAARARDSLGLPGGTRARSNNPVASPESDRIYTPEPHRGHITPTNQSGVDRSGVNTRPNSGATTRPGSQTPGDPQRRPSGSRGLDSPSQSYHVLERRSPPRSQTSPPDRSHNNGGNNGNSGNNGRPGHP